MVGSRVVCGEVDKDLLGVPVEQGGQVCVEVKLDKGVLAVSSKAVVVRAAEDDVEVREGERGGREARGDDKGREGDG